MAGRAQAQVMEVPGSHAIYVSRPEEVAEIIRQAANASI
jgi:carboxypeptidase C (cathepsin A)